MIRTHTLLAYSIGLLLLQTATGLQAFEAGSLTPPPPAFQLPPLQTSSPEGKSLSLPTDSATSAKDAPGNSSVRFILKSVVFDGAKALDNQALQALAAPYINKPVARLELDNLRLQILEAYKQAGFIYPSVLLPNQHIQNGVVHYQINESRISAVNVKGNEGLHQDYITKRLLPDDEQALQRAELQDRFQTLLSDPLIERVNGVLRPGLNPGDTVLDLEVKRAQPYELHLGMDNYTPPTVGAYTGRLDGLVRNLTGWGDFLRVNLAGSEGTKTIGAYFSMPLNAYDTRLNLGYQGNESEVVDSNLKSLGIENSFMDVNVGISQPLYRSLNRIFSVEAQFAFKQTNTSLNPDFIAAFPMPLGEGVEENGKAKASVFRFIQNYLDRDAERVLSLRSTMNAGVDFFNATINPNGIADGRFFSWVGQLRYLRKLDERGSEFFMRSDIQLASESLLPLERFALGGINTVRGYRQNELVRNEGYAVALELRYPLFSQQTLNGHQLKLVPFFDIGGVFSSTRFDGTQEASKTLMSTGLGLQWSWRALDADLYWARALSSSSGLSRSGDSDLQDSGIHFRLHARIL